MDIRKAFELWCGPDIKYEGHEAMPKGLRFSYSVPGSPSPETILTVHFHVRNGLSSTKFWAIRKAALCAMQDGYLRSGRYDRDVRQLLQRKLV